MQTKRYNYKQIYVQIVKYGKTIQEMANQYGIDAKHFSERLQKGLDTKLFADVIKADERIRKRQENAEKKLKKQEEVNMARKNQETVKTMQVSKEQQQESKERSMEQLLAEKRTATENVEEAKKELEKAQTVLSIRENSLKETKELFEEAKKALTEAEVDRAKAKENVDAKSKELDTFIKKMNDVESSIEELKKQKVYLVEPGYTGEIPSYGTFYSFTEVKGVNVQIKEANGKFAIEPDIKDMLVAGYDSYTEYSCGLRFAMLCLDFASKKIKYEVLISDERVKKLYETHVSNK